MSDGVAAGRRRRNKLIGVITVLAVAAAVLQAIPERIALGQDLSIRIADRSDWIMGYTHRFIPPAVNKATLKRGDVVRCGNALLGYKFWRVGCFEVERVER